MIPSCLHHARTGRPLLRQFWICAAHSCSFVWCFNSALVILTPHNTIVAERFATFRNYCIVPVQPLLAFTVTILKRKDTQSVSFLSGMPDWIRTSGLQSRSSQAVKPESPAAQELSWVYTDFRHFKEKPQKPCRAGLLRFFAVVVK